MQKLFFVVILQILQNLFEIYAAVPFANFYFRSEFRLSFLLKIQVSIPTNCWNILNKNDDDKYAKLQFYKWMTEFFFANDDDGSFFCLICKFATQIVAYYISIIKIVFYFYLKISTYLLKILSSTSNYSHKNVYSKMIYAVNLLLCIFRITLTSNIYKQLAKSPFILYHTPLCSKNGKIVQ